MSIEVGGKLVNFWYRRSGTSNPFKKIVCVEDSEFTITSELSKRRTNCGLKGVPSDPEFSASINAVQNINPGALEGNYEDIKSFITNKYKADFQYASDEDAANGVGYGDGIFNYGSGYFSELGAAASAESDGLLTFSVNFEGVGVLDVYDTDS
ncbi:MAG: hypothetical protein JNK14_07530 [Chitinophagaceae bacterium]|nr:hypothetical protein [Chitinophagaceae bacterium]